MSQPEQKKTSLRSQSAWLLFAKVVGFGFASLLPLMVVRFLTKENVGVYQQVFQVIVNATSILPMGFSMSAFYFLSRETTRRKYAVFNILLFNFVMGGLTCLLLYFQPQLLGKLFNGDELTEFAPKIGVVIWLWIFSAFLETVAIANGEAKLATIFIIIAQFSKTALMVGAVVLFATVEAFIYAAMIQATVQTIVLFIYLNSRFPSFWRAFDLKFFREHLVYALPFGFAGLLYTMQNDIHRYFIGNNFSKADYAIYTIGCFQLPLIAMLHESVMSVLIPRMSELQSSNNKPEMIRLMMRAMEKLSFFYFPLYIFFLITAPIFITTLFTDNFAASVSIFLVNITLLPFEIAVLDPIVRAYKELGRFLVILRVFIFTLLVAGLYLSTKYLDLRGIIAVVIAAAIIERIISFVVITRKLEMKISDLKLLKGVLNAAYASLAAGSVLFLFYWLGQNILTVCFELSATIFKLIGLENIAHFVGGCLFLGLCMIIFSTVYLLISNYFGLIDEEEKNIFRKQVDRFKMIFKKGNIHNPPTEIPN